MKKLRYITLALACTLLASCMGDDYEAPSLHQSPYGNNALTETNVMTIAEVKDKYKSVISASGMTEVTEDIQIKGRVTGNDIQGNIYNQFAMQDESGAIIISVAQGGMYGYLPVGQEVLISLKGLIIGGYGSQPQVGGIYTNTKTGAESVGRMSRFTWGEHYKLIGTAEPQSVQPVEFDKNKRTDKKYLEDNCGKLMTIKNVTFKQADGKITYAPNDGSAVLTANAVNRELVGIGGSTLVVRTSTYADFAGLPLPTEAVDITGIFTRYRNTWQVLLRTANDVQPAQ